MRAFALCLLCAPALADEFPVQRCINVDQALEAPVEGAWGYTVDRDDMRWIAEQGFDSIRLPVRFSAHWDGEIAPDFLARVDEIISWAIADDMNVILDLHHFEELMIEPEENAATFDKIWQAIGDHYAGYDGRLIFELLNEPSENLGTAQAVALYQEIIPDLRRQHPDRWIVIEGGDWAHFATLPDLPLIDDRTVLSFHYYLPFPFTHQLASWHEDPMPAATWGSKEERAALRADFAKAAETQGPILLGEFGVTGTTELAQRTRWIKAVREEAEQHGMGWCHWGFAAGFAVMDEDTRGWLPGMQDALMSDGADN